MINMHGDFFFMRYFLNEIPDFIMRYFLIRKLKNLFITYNLYLINYFFIKLQCRKLGWNIATNCHQLVAIAANSNHWRKFLAIEEKKFFFFFYNFFLLLKSVFCCFQAIWKIKKWKVFFIFFILCESFLMRFTYNFM